MDKEQQIKNLVDDLFWQYDRLSSYGKENLNELATLVGTHTHQEMMKEVTKEVWTLKEINLSKGVSK